MDNPYMPARHSFYLRLHYIGIGLVLMAHLTACSDGLTDLERIKQRGHLRVVFLAAPPMFFPDESVLRGLDYQMVVDYTETLNVELDVITARTLGEMLRLLRQNKAHIGVADSAPPLPDKDINASHPYNPNQWYVIGNRKYPLPDNLAGVTPGKLVVASASGPALVMKTLKQKHNTLNWMELPEGTSRQVLEQVNLNRFKLSAINADVFAYYRHLYPELKVAFQLDESFPSNWLTFNAMDNSLESSINTFIDKYKRSGKLEKLRASYFRHLDLFRYVDNIYFLKRIKSLYPAYEPLFAKAASEYGFDERFLAAVSYQESHWNKDAKSMTGVRGLMMLTQETAKRVGVTDRLDPKESIFGGAKYLNILKESLPTHIQEPDRSWMTLAAYNVGLGHLEDARVLTERGGDDPDLWVDVEKYLPRLSEKKWYKQTRYGYARGHEPVAFVRRIHRYFDILRLYEQEALLKKLNRPINYDRLQFSSPIL